MGIPDEDEPGDVGIRLGEVVTGATEWRRLDCAIMAGDPWPLSM